MWKTVQNAALRCCSSGFSAHASTRHAEISPSVAHLHSKLAFALHAILDFFREQAIVVRSGRREMNEKDPKGRESCANGRSEEHTSELQSPDHLVCRLLLEKKKKNTKH